MLREKEGSITVFLSLVLLLILAVTMTTVEAARVNGANVYTERAFRTAMDSVLSEYYFPLFQEYHLFGLDGSYGTGNTDLDAISAKLNDYMEYTFHPGKELEDLRGEPYQYFNLYGINTESVNIGKTNTLMEFDGELFVNQAVSYMKYKEIGDGIEAFLPKLSIAQETEKAQPVLEKKQETEERLYEIDERILSLMGLIDGITIGEKGIKVNRDGKIGIQENFVKKIYTLPVTKDNLGIHNELAFHSLNGHYVNPNQIIDSSLEGINSLYENAAKKESAEETYQRLISIDQMNIKDPEELSALRKSISDVKKKLNAFKKTEQELIKALNRYMKELNKLVEGTLPAIKSAQKLIDELIPIQEEAGIKVRDYEKYLSGSKGLLSDDLYRSLTEDLINMEKYKGTGGAEGGSVGQYDFKEMKNTLRTDETILLEIMPDTRLTVSAAKESWTKLKLVLAGIRRSLADYSYDKLQFDYSTLVQPVESGSFFSGIKSMLEDGIMGLMIEDMDKIPDKELNGTELPSGIHKIHSGEEPAAMVSFISQIDLSGGKGLLSGMMDDFSKVINFKETALGGVEGAGKLLLLQEYLLEHFGSYGKSDLPDGMKVLDYELEYIIKGKSTDYENLKTVLMRIVLIRTVMNLITLLSDKKYKEEAHVLAIGFVGFTGLPALVEVTGMIVLTAWAFAEALVDGSALLQGKTLPFLKKGSDIQIGLYELFSLNKALIKSKAVKMKESKSVLDLGYTDYLKLFLCMEGQENKSFRAMDLIQKNIQIKYEDSFFIKNCIFGFQAEADFRLDSKFTDFPFIRQMSDKKDKNNSYIYHISMEYSY